MRDVAGVEPAGRIELLSPPALVIGTGDRRATDLEPAEGLAVPRTLDILVVGDLHLDAKGRMALLHLDIVARLAFELVIFRLEAAERADRAHLGHAPGMNDIDIVIFLEGLDHRARGGRTADHDRAEIGQLAALFFHMLQQAEPHGRHGGRDRYALVGQKAIDRLAVHARPGHDERRADHRGGERNAPAIGVEERHHGHQAISRGKLHRIRLDADHRMEHIRAVRIDDALRVARRAGRVAHAGCRALVEIFPEVVIVDFGQPLLVGHDIGQARLRHMRRIGQDNHLFERRHQRRDLLDNGHEGNIDEEEAVFRIVHDPGDLLREKPRVQRVIDCAATHDAVPGFQMPPGVPGQRSDAVADLDSVLLEPLGHLQRTAAHRGIIGAMDRTFDGP